MSPQLKKVQEVPLSDGDCYWWHPWDYFFFQKLSEFQVLKMSNLTFLESFAKIQVIQPVNAEICMGWEKISWYHCLANGASL